MFIKINDLILNKNYIHYIECLENEIEFVAKFWFKDSNSTEISVNLKMKKSLIKITDLDNFILHLFGELNGTYGPNCLLKDIA